MQKAKDAAADWHGGERLTAQARYQYRRSKQRDTPASENT